MAGQSRIVKNRIVATKKTSQITKAMNMVSASKLKNAEKAINEYRPFIQKTKDIINHLAQDDASKSHPLMEVRPVQKICYLVISSDRGLAGAFNANVCKELTKKIKALDPKISFVVLPIGLKAYTYAVKQKYPLLTGHIINIRDDIEFGEITEVIMKIVASYLTKDIDQVEVIYNHYKNTLIQEITTEIILPVAPSDNKKYNTSYEFDGDALEILNMALPIYIENTIYSYVLDSKASEHAARMNSMKNATDNAEEVIASLELLYNRARQAAITLELTDIVGGASVVNNN